MTDYTQNITFADKDALVTGDPNKLIKGSDVDGEFSEIATAIATKIDAPASPAAGDFLIHSGSAWTAAAGPWEWVEYADLTTVTTYDLSAVLADNYEYRVVIRDLSGDTAAWNGFMQLKNDDGTLLTNSGDYYGTWMAAAQTGLAGVASTGPAFFNYSGFTSLVAADSLDVDLVITGAMDTGVRTSWRGSAILKGSTKATICTFGVSLEAVDGHNAIRIGVTGVNVMDTGEAWLLRRRERT
jgi:hypothetical protein